LKDWTYHNNDNNNDVTVLSCWYRPEQPAAGPADCKPSSADSQPTKKDCARNKTSAMLAACVVGEEAQPEIGVTPNERRVWGDIFQNRQHFVDMHFC